jgi:hypothetical protein
MFGPRVGLGGPELVALAAMAVVLFGRRPAERLGRLMSPTWQKGSATAE